MNPKDYRWYVLNAIEQCDYLLNSKNADYSKLMNQILKIKELGLAYADEMICDCANKLSAYNSSDYELDIIEQTIAIILSLKGPMPFSNKENSKQKRYLIQSKLLLHGIDEALRRNGH